MEILRLAAVGLGIEENSFTYMFSYQPCSSLRMQHYPPWTEQPPELARTEDGRFVTTPNHTDSGFLALLSTFSFPGLEYLSPSGKWTPITPRPDSLILNIGDLFSSMVGGRFKATCHRIIDIGVDRFSVPFFLEPNYDREVGFDLIKKSTGEDVSAREKYGPWVIAQMSRKGFYEFASLPKF
ncbi:2-oxoglutarate-dependent dioxygenase citB-like [Pecten maximus]|uniref:2-oxoglutarate-dependent dioxygenase citB-like n=1 Tax=Pecten maximus TaxID=6579 RepID=UPI001458477D|nr:2-oxoglutarate-dependent dioxygenase citB-like [Pecten maximus]